VYKKALPLQACGVGALLFGFRNTIMNYENMKK